MMEKKFHTVKGAVSPSGDFWWSDEGPLPSWFPEDHAVYPLPEDQEPDEFLEQLLNSPAHRSWNP